MALYVKLVAADVSQQQFDVPEPVLIFGRPHMRRSHSWVIHIRTIVCIEVGGGRRPAAIQRLQAQHGRIVPCHAVVADIMRQHLAEVCESSGQILIVTDSYCAYILYVGTHSPHNIWPRSLIHINHTDDRVPLLVNMLDFSVFIKIGISWSVGLSAAMCWRGNSGVNKGGHDRCC